jgi:hypothetical protein
MAKDYIALADLIGRAEMLELRCGRCERRGRLSVARLARDYAPETPLRTIMRAQIGIVRIGTRSRTGSGVTRTVLPSGRCSRSHDKTVAGD